VLAASDSQRAKGSSPASSITQLDFSRRSTVPPTCSRACLLVAGSGDKQAKAKLCRLEIEEVAVAFDPPTRCEVITEAAHCPLLGVRPDAGPHGYSATDVLVQVRRGPAPLGLEEAVSTIPRNGHRLHPGADRARQLSSEADARGSDLGQVVTSQPEPATPTRQWCRT
jgi:hypothetical protein